MTVGGVLALVLFHVASASGQAPEPRSPVGKAVSAAGTLLRAIPDKAWAVVQPQEGVSSADLLMALPGQQGEIETNGVRLTLWGNLPEVSSDSVLESVLRLHAEPGSNAGFTLERGRVVIGNVGATGAVHVRVRFRDQSWDIALNDTDSRVSIELDARLPRGLTFHHEADAADPPVVNVGLWVLKGQVDLRVAGSQFSLHAPPGPAYFRWDSVRGTDAGPRRRERLPDWTQPAQATASEPRDWRDALEHQRRELASRPVDQVLASELGADNRALRDLSVYALAAIDDLPHLIDALSEPSHADVRLTGITALEHWLGRGPRQGAALYDFLVKRRDYSPAQAEILVQLLYGLPEEARQVPGTYEALIAYLRQAKLPIRELARRQLDLWVPAGRKITYDAAAGEVDRERGYADWKQLVPSGKLPPRSERP
jgi:hypothetical protein